MARHGRARCATVFAFDDLAEFFNGHLVTAHLDKGADDGSHHVAQEAVGSDGENPLFIFMGPLGMGDAAVVGLDVGVQLGERCEIGIVEQTSCSLVHQVEVKLWRTFPTQRVVERVLAGDGEVLVGAAGGVKAGMSLVMDGRYAVDGNVGWQQGVEAMNESFNVRNGYRE